MYAVIEIDTSKPAQLRRTGGVKVLSLHPTMDKAHEAWKGVAFAACDYHHTVHRVVEVPSC